MIIQSSYYYFWELRKEENRSCMLQTKLFPIRFIVIILKTINMKAEPNELKLKNSRNDMGSIKTSKNF